MIKKYKDYIFLLIVFLIIIFSPYLNTFFREFDTTLTTTVINNNYCNSLENEYNSLLQANEFLNTSSLNLTISKVLFRNIYSFSDNITIYKGENSSIKNGSAVITDKGLVGVVSKVDKESSIVSLITNESMNISVKVGSAYGILKMQSAKLIVSNLTMFENINVGDSIYTSGIGNLPGDIYIGEVENITSNGTQIEMILEVKQAVNLNDINYVMVVN